MEIGAKVKITSGLETGAIGTVTGSIGPWNTVDMGEGKTPSGYFDDELELIEGEQ